MNRPADERDQLTVDAIAGGIARVEVAGRTLEIPAAWLPHGTGEGDVVTLRVSSRGDSTSLQLELDPRATERARNRIRSKLDQLRKRGNT